MNHKLFFWLESNCDLQEIVPFQPSSHTDHIDVASLYDVFACDPQDDPLL